MRYKLSIRKSQPFIYLVFLLALFIFGLIIVLLSEPLSLVHDSYYNDTELSDNVYQTFYQRSTTIWYWILLPAIICMIIWFSIQVSEKGQGGV